MRKKPEKHKPRRQDFHGRNILLFTSAVITMTFLVGILLDSGGEAEEQEPWTYIALGDSLTAGIGASEVDYLRINAFVPRFTAYLRERQDVYVENHGIPGVTTSGLLEYVRTDPGLEEAVEEADLLTLTIGGNDLLQLLSRDELNEETTEQTVEQFGQLFLQVIEEIRQHNADVPIYAMELYSPYDEGHSLHELGQTTVLNFNRELQQQIRAVENVYQVPVYEVFQGKGAEWTHIEEEDIHPNDEGYAIIFEAFQEVLAENDK